MLFYNYILKAWLLNLVTVGMWNLLLVLSKQDREVVKFYKGLINDHFNVCGFIFFLQQFFRLFAIIKRFIRYSKVIILKLFEPELSFVWKTIRTILNWLATLHANRVFLYLSKSVYMWPIFKYQYIN